MSWGLQNTYFFEKWTNPIFLFPGLPCLLLILLLCYLCIFSSVLFFEMRCFVLSSCGYCPKLTKETSYSNGHICERNSFRLYIKISIFIFIDIWLTILITCNWSSDLVLPLCSKTHHSCSGTSDQMLYLQHPGAFFVRDNVLKTLVQWALR